MQFRRLSAPQKGFQFRIFFLILVRLTKADHSKQGHIPFPALRGKCSHVDEGLVLKFGTNKGTGGNAVSTKLQGLFNCCGQPFAGELRAGDGCAAADVSCETRNFSKSGGKKSVRSVI